MAALTTTAVTKRLRLGDRLLVTLRATSGSSANPADEYIDVPGLSSIDAVLGWAPIGTSAVAAAATGTVTFSATDPTDQDTITVDGIVYTIENGALTSYDVDMSTTENTMAANFAAAINRTGTPGTTYSDTIAAHPTVKAVAATNVVTLTARNPGAGGNAITLTEASTGATASGATLTGGSDAVSFAAFKKNASGTGNTEGANPGNLGVEFGAVSVLFEVTVIGLP